MLRASGVVAGAAFRPGRDSPGRCESLTATARRSLTKLCKSLTLLKANRGDVDDTAPVSAGGNARVARGCEASFSQRPPRVTPFESEPTSSTARGRGTGRPRRFSSRVRRRHPRLGRARANQRGHNS